MTTYAVVDEFHHLQAPCIHENGWFVGVVGKSAYLWLDGTIHDSAMADVDDDEVDWSDKNAIAKLIERQQARKESGYFKTKDDAYQAIMQHYFRHKKDDKLDYLLKPCPFCGGKAELCIPPYADDWDTHVYCTGCECVTAYRVSGVHYEGVIESIELWNMRVG